MIINVRGKNIEVTPALEEHIEKRLEKLDKFFDENTEIQIVLSLAGENHIAEATVFFNSLILRSEESTEDMYASVDMMVSKLEKQVTRYREKLKDRLQQGGVRSFNEVLTSEEEEKEGKDEPQVVRTKRFILKPMTVEEAILQMNLLEHNFFVFMEAETGAINVLYRRKDGNYGLIEPEL